jgi:MarR family transcriptional regulator, 2-MHQ and catechol-resistance regulon repressor
MYYTSANFPDKKENPNMVLDLESGNTIMRLWLLLHRANDALCLCEDSMLHEYGLTLEQWRLLAHLQYYGRPLGPSELATSLERSANSVSMLVDRMVKAGLVRRTRDRKDRRVVHVWLTSKGESAVGPATPEIWKLIQEILSPLSSEDKQVLADLLEAVKCEAHACLYPERDKDEIIKTSGTKDPKIYERNLKNLYRSTANPNTNAKGQQEPCPDVA